MKDRELKRDNALSDAELIADCRERIGQARLDLPELTQEGLTAADLDSFDEEVTAFERMPDDEALLYQQQKLRLVRDERLEAARSVIRDVLNPLRRAYGENSPEVKRFGAERLADLSVAEVLNVLVDAQQVAPDYLTEAPAQREGFSATRLAPLGPAYEALKEAQKAFKDAEQSRLEGTRARVEAYNRLNGRAAALCAKGYDHYVERNEVKARAYVRNPASRPGTETPESPK